jgi:hypothetical protein
LVFAAADPTLQAHPPDEGAEFEQFSGVIGDNYTPTIAVQQDRTASGPVVTQRLGHAHPATARVGFDVS